MLWKQRRLIACGCFVLTCASAVIIKRLPNVYRTDVIIIVDSQKIPEKFVSSTVQATLSDSMSSISQQVLKSTKLEEIIQEFNLYPTQRKERAIDEVVAQFRKDLPITLERGFVGGRPGAFRIAYEGTSAAMVAGVVNRVADLFVHENRKTRERRAEGTSEFLEAQMNEARKSLDQQEASLSRFKLQWAGELPQQEHALLGALSRLQVQLEANGEAVTRAQQSKILLESTLHFAESSLAAAIRSAEPVRAAPAAGTDSQIGSAAPLPAATRAESLRARLAGLRRRYQDDHPEIRRLRIELEDALAEETQLATNLPAPAVVSKTGPVSPQPVATPAVSSQALAEINRERERIATIKTQIDLLNREVETKNSERGRITIEIADYQRRVEKLPIREQQIASLTRDYEITKANYRSLLDKKLSAEMASDMERQDQSERFTIADPARLPESHSKPKRMMLYLGAAMGSLLLCALLGLAIEFRKNVFLGEWELPPHVRVIGRISFIDRTRGQGGASSASDFGHLIADAGSPLERN